MKNGMVLFVALGLAACGPRRPPPVAPPLPDTLIAADTLVRDTLVADTVVADTVPADTLPTDPRVELLWDTYGVPHIIAEDMVAMFYAFGWAQMRNHGDLLLRLYGQARGRAAEYWGADQLDSDRWVRTNGIPSRAREWWGLQSPYLRAYVEGFVDGVNAYALKHANAITDSLEVVLPIVPADVLAHVQRVIHFTFVASPEMVHGVTGGWRAGAGSNAWAISPRRAEGRNAMLLANPHLPWGDLFTFFETQLTAPDFDAYGVALVGFPVPSIAFNDSLGWTHTVNTFDGADLYELRLVEGGYAWDEGVRPFDSDEHVLKVKQPDGSMVEERLVVRRSLHGPVVAEKDSGALALRVVGLDQPHVLEQTWQMLRARNLAEFETALSRLQLPMFTVVFADNAGHILNVFNGQVPMRDRGDFRYWSGVVRGDTSATLWTRYHGYTELPRVLDPAAGWVHNANEPPWTATLPFALDPDAFPPYMAPPPFMHFRAQRSARMLAEDEQISFEELVAYKHSTRMEASDHIIEDLVYAARTHGGEGAKRAADVLERWDRQAEPESRGAILFQAFMRELWRGEWPRGSPWDVDWSPIAPLATPDGLADPRAAAEALDAAAAAVERAYTALDQPWGGVYRVRLDSLDYPANGGPGELGIFRVEGFERDADGLFRATFGDSFVAAVEFGRPVRARALLSYGNASQPGSRHRGDQLQLFARKQLRPVWRTRAEVEANLTRKEAF